MCNETDRHRLQCKIAGAVTGMATFALLRYKIQPALCKDYLKRTGFFYWAGMGADVGLGAAWGAFLHVNKPVDLSLMSKFSLLPGRSEVCYELSPGIVSRARKAITEDKEKAEMYRNPQTAWLEETRAMYEDRIRATSIMYDGENDGNESSRENARSKNNGEGGPVRFSHPGVPVRQLPKISDTYFYPKLLERAGGGSVNVGSMTTDKKKISFIRHLL